MFNQPTPTRLRSNVNNSFKEFVLDQLGALPDLRAFNSLSLRSARGEDKGEGLVIP